MRSLRVLDLVRMITLLLLSFAWIGCSKGAPSPAGGADDYETLELRYQGSVGAVSFAELGEELGFLAPIKLHYVGSTISGPQSIQTVVTGDTDFGGAFNGAVIKLFLAKAPIQAVIGSYGVDKDTWFGYYVLDDSPVQSARDLIGKKVAMNTLGAHMELVLKEYLLRNGLSRDEAAQVTMVVVPPVNAEQALRQRQVEVAVLAGVMRDKALERGGVRLLFSDYQLFGEFTAGTLVMTKRFLHDKPKAARKFVESTAKAIDWAQHAPREEVIARFEKIVGKRSRSEDPSMLKYWRSTGVAGEGGVIAKADFQRWIDWMVREGDPLAGKIPLQELYTNQLNPFWKGDP